MLVLERMNLDGRNYIFEVTDPKSNHGVSFHHEYMQKKIGSISTFCDFAISRITNVFISHSSRFASLNVICADHVFKITVAIRTVAEFYFTEHI